MLLHGRPDLRRELFAETVMNLKAYEPIIDPSLPLISFEEGGEGEYTLLDFLPKEGLKELRLAVCKVLD